VAALASTFLFEASAVLADAPDVGKFEQTLAAR